MIIIEHCFAKNSLKTFLRLPLGNQCQHVTENLVSDVVIYLPPHCHAHHIHVHVFIGIIINVLIVVILTILIIIIVVVVVIAVDIVDNVPNNSCC